LSPLAYFRELHLVPRVIFTFGGILFFAGLFIHSVELSLFSIGLVFFAVTWNLLIDTFFRGTWFGGLVQSLMTAAIALFCFYIAVYLYRHGSLPPQFQRLPPTVK
jgi:hypothetical protein